MKKLVKDVLSGIGYEMHKIQHPPTIGSVQRPVGDMKCFLEDIRQRGIHCPSVLDVGANKAEWSRMAKAIFPEARFSLIEPQEEMKPYLEAFCSENRNSNYILAGAGAASSIQTMTVYEDHASSSFLPREDASLKEAGMQRDIEIVTIDDLIESQKIGVPELMKLDVQGFELEALKGAGTTFGCTEVYILEVSLFQFDPGMPTVAQVINFMLERGYVVYDFAGFLRRPMDGALGQCDICFVKEDGVLRASNKWM